MLESVADMGIVFNTEFNNKLNCRGDGKLYLLYEAASVFPDAVESKSPNGQIHPQESFLFQRLNLLLFLPILVSTNRCLSLAEIM